MHRAFLALILLSSCTESEHLFSVPVNPDATVDASMDAAPDADFDASYPDANMDAAAMDALFRPPPMTPDAGTSTCIPNP